MSWQMQHNYRRPSEFRPKKQRHQSDQVGSRNVCRRRETTASVAKSAVLVWPQGRKRLVGKTIWQPLWNRQWDVGIQMNCNTNSHIFPRLFSTRRFSRRESEGGLVHNVKWKARIHAPLCYHHQDSWFGDSAKSHTFLAKSNLRCMKNSCVQCVSEAKYGVKHSCPTCFN